MTRKMNIRFLVHLAFALTLSSGAMAHATLERATPAVGSVVATSPSEIRIQLSEPVDPAASSISVSAESGAAVATGGVSSAPGDKRTLVVRIGQRLAPGAYKVRWRAVSLDAHKSQGGFGFQVRP